jgi:hypothetical protein
MTFDDFGIVSGLGTLVSSRVQVRVCTRRSELGVQEHELYIVAEQPRCQISTKLMKSPVQKKCCSKKDIPTA